MEPGGAARPGSTTPRRALARVDIGDPRAAALSDLVANLSADVLDDVGPRLRQVVDEHLARVGRVLGGVRVAVFRVDHRQRRAVVEFEWHALGVPGLRDRRSSVDLAELPWTLDELRNVPLHVDRDGPVAAWFSAGSVLAVPIVVDGRVAEIVAACWPSSQPAWDPVLLPMLRTLAATTLAARDRVSLAERVSHDDVTGLANRRLLLLVLGQMLARLARGKAAGVSVLFCELSGLGRRDLRAEPTVGEDAFSRAARLLERSTRETDLVGRFDDTTFAVVCDDVGAAHDALRIGRRLQAVTAAEVRASLSETAVGRRRLTEELRVPVGVAYASDPVATGVLLRQADLALYHARSEPADPVKLVVE